MVKTTYPEKVGIRRAEKMKAVANKDFQAVLFSVAPLDPAVLQVGLVTDALEQAY